MGKTQVLAALTCTAGLLACQAEPVGTPAPTGPTWYQDVRPIVQGHCGECHKAGAIGGFDLQEPAQVKAHKAAVTAQLQARTMPPWPLDPGGTAMKYDMSLTDQQIKTVVAWLNAGGPLGDAAHPAPVPQVQRPTLSRQDFSYQLPDPYHPKDSPDDYRCFIIPWSATTTKYVTGFGVDPGNPAIAHHAVLFAIGKEFSANVEAMDATDPLPGYKCYGGPAVGKKNDNVIFQFLGAWAPGESGSDYPAGTGLKVEPGTQLILQMHYNNADSSATDQTRFHLALADQVEHQAWYMPWFDLQWFMDRTTMKIDAGAAHVTQEYTEIPAQSPMPSIFLPGADISKGFRVHATFPHMHVLGAEQQLDVLHPDGQEVSLLNLQRWDFHWQRMYFLAKPVDVSGTDKLRVRCTWNNSAEAQPYVGGQQVAPKEQHFGEGTSDEMCIGFVYLTLP